MSCIGLRTVFAAILALPLASLLGACSSPPDEAVGPAAATAATAGPLLAAWEGVLSEDGSGAPERVEVPQQDYEDWLAWRGLTAQEAHLRDFATALVLQRMAQARAAAQPAQERAQAEQRLRQHLLGEALVTRLQREVVVDEAEVEAAWQAVGGEERRPQRWQLRNLFLSLPPDAAAQADVRERMAELRAQLLAGADFAALAAEHSQSQTRFREARLGLLTLEQLPPAAAAAVAGLQAGQLSEIVQTADGLSLFLCERVVEAEVLSGESLREAIRQRLLRQARQAVAEDLDARLLAASGLQPGSAETRLRLPALRAQAAIDAGLLDDPAVLQQLRWRSLMQQAQTELLRRAQTQGSEPDEAALRAQYERMLARGQGWHRYRVAGIDFGEPNAASQAQARQVEAALAAGSLSFSAAARQYSRDASAAQGGELGWFTVRTLAARDWMMMRAVRQMAVGDSSGLIHSGGRLWIYQLLEHQQGEEVRFEDVREELARRQQQARPRALQGRLRAEIASQVQLLAPAS